VLLQIGCGLGVDDTEKRRSEEILRAVAAAATADYEGLQQMKFQKTSTTRTLSAAASTKECVEKLQKALEAEELGLNKEAKKAKGELAGHLNETIGVEATEMKQALHNALIAVYTSLHDRYQQVQTHATAMMEALTAEIEGPAGKGSNITAEFVLQQIIAKTAYQLAINKQPDLTREHWDAPAITCMLQYPIADKDVAAFYRNTVCRECTLQADGCYCGIGDFDEDLEEWKNYNGPTSAYKHEKTCLPQHWDTPGGFEFEDAVLSELTDMLLANAQGQAFNEADDDDKDVTQSSLIALNTILAGPHLCVDHCEDHVVSQSGWGVNTTPYGDNYWQFNLAQDKFKRRSFETRYHCSCDLAGWTATATSFGATYVRTCTHPWRDATDSWEPTQFRVYRKMEGMTLTLGFPKPRAEDYPTRQFDPQCPTVGGTGDHIGVFDWSRDEEGEDEGAMRAKFNPTHFAHWSKACDSQLEERLAYKETRQENAEQCALADRESGSNLCEWNCVDAGGGHRSNKNREEWKGRIDFEDKQLSRVERAYINYMKQKSMYHNHTTGHSALQSAKKMVMAKIDALVKSKEHIKVYEVELDTLQDDEMRRIADIKEEFESLAADWLQLATYHCCDIVQGNTVECEDATDHLMQPINNVFPNALKKPDPARDCTRRLL